MQTHSDKQKELVEAKAAVLAHAQTIKEVSQS